MSKLYRTGYKNDVMKQALKDAVKYQRSIIDAWTPEQSWVEISDDVQRVIDDANDLITDYQRILGHTISL